VAAAATPDVESQRAEESRFEQPSDFAVPEAREPHPENGNAASQQEPPAWSAPANDAQERSEPREPPRSAEPREHPDVDARTDARESRQPAPEPVEPAYREPEAPPRRSEFAAEVDDDTRPPGQSSN
jgi:hypothetical protein